MTSEHLRAALISQMSPPPGERRNFDRWYREEHIPARMAIRGFLSAVRGWAVQGTPDHLAIYYLEDLAVLRQQEYAELKESPTPLTTHMLNNVAEFTRWPAELIADSGQSKEAQFLYLVTFPVPDDALDVFDQWYSEDHAPTLLEADGWVRIRRYSVRKDGHPSAVSRIIVHELSDPKALDSPERQKARKSKWRAELAEAPWFGRAHYAVYEQVQRFSGRSHGA